MKAFIAFLAQPFNEVFGDESAFGDKRRFQPNRVEEPGNKPRGIFLQVHQEAAEEAGPQEHVFPSDQHPRVGQPGGRRRAAQGRLQGEAVLGGQERHLSRPHAVQEARCGQNDQHDFHLRAEHGRAGRDCHLSAGKSLCYTLQD